MKPGFITSHQISKDNPNRRLGRLYQLTTSWDVHGIKYINYLEPAKRLMNSFISSCIWLRKKTVFIEIMHVCPLVLSSLQNSRSWDWNYLHTPYSSDLAPSDDFLFPNMRKWLGGKKNVAEVERLNFFEKIQKEYVGLNVSNRTIIIFKNGINATSWNVFLYIPRICSSNSLIFYQDSAPITKSDQVWSCSCHTFSIRAKFLIWI